MYNLASLHYTIHAALSRPIDLHLRFCVRLRLIHQVMYVGDMITRNPANRCTYSKYMAWLSGVPYSLYVVLPHSK